MALATFFATALVLGIPSLTGAMVALLPGGGMFRFNVKFALVGAMAASLVAAVGFERLTSDAATRRRWTLALAVLLTFELVVVAALSMPGSPIESAFRSLFARGLGDDAVAALRGRWIGSALFQSALAAAALLAVRASRLRPMAALALFALHAAGQLPIVRALSPSDASAPYRQPPALLRALPDDAVTVHGSAADLFASGYFESGSYPDARALWRSRRGFEDLYSFPLAAAGRRTEFRPSSEGLDAFPVQATASAIRRLDDAQRLRLLAATGVDHLLLPRPIEARDGDDALPVASSTGSPPMHLYRLPGAIPDALVVGAWSYAPHMNAALEGVLDPDFDPSRRAILAGDGAPREGSPGRASIVRWDDSRIELEVDSESGGVAIVRRAWVGIWRAEVDGRPAPVRIANLTRLAVEVPPGAHRVRFYVSQRPFAVGVGLSALGAVMLVALTRRRPLSRRDLATGAAEGVE